MWPPWLWKDAPSARVRGPGLLEAHRLYFRKLSEDRSTKADIGRRRGSVVWGVLFDIDERDVRELNRKEGGYDPISVSVRLAGGSDTRAWSYMARPERGRSRVRPYRWYIELIRSGAVQFGFPRDYIERIGRRLWKNDADEERVRAAAAFLVTDPTLPVGRSLLVVERACDAQTRVDLIAQLESDRNAAWAAGALRRGEVTPWHATISGRAVFAAVSTTFEVLGTTRAIAATGRRRFLISEARQCWRQAAASDPIEYQKLERYIADVSSGSGIRNRMITLLDDANGLRIVDGNKRALAIYSAAAEDLRLPVFVLYPRAVTPVVTGSADG